ncbi:PAS domain-containing protein [Vreelandella olivaria]|uniref:PAS domain-containing protein n=1 Tax=Vreelandella olivaria TaxID=390919 RepID=UPI00201F7E5A|nr:PAS domain-containing protein [Halomonas olivaria]
MPVDLHAFYPKLKQRMLDTVFVVDENNRIVFVSDTCEPLLGCSSDTLIGTSITHSMHFDDLATIRDSTHSS